MKKLSIALLLVATSFVSLAGCKKSSGGGGGGGSSGGNTDGTITVNFYADYNQLNEKNVYVTQNVKNGAKLTKPADPTKAPMPEFPVFLGWSYKEIIDDKKDLWDFSTDTVQTNEPSFNLFGIWVAQGEQ